MTHNEDSDDLLTELIDEEGADDTRELHKPCATPNSLSSTLQKEYNDLLVNNTTSGSHQPCEGKPEMGQNWQAMADVDAHRGDYTNVH